MGEKRVIEQIASDEIYNDDWFLKDSVLHDTTKVQPSVIKEYVNQGMATSQDLADEATARQNMDSQLASGIGQQMSNLADFYDTTKSYVVGDVCVLQSGELMRCIAPTSGTFDNTKWEQVTVDELFDDLNFSANAISYDNTSSGLEADNVQDAIDETITKLSAVGSASGDIATFDDGSDLPMPKLEVAIEPVQDLHGYDAPWVGGAGKNKFNCTATTQTKNQVTFTINNDGTVSLSGTASATASVLIGTITLSAGTYILSGGVDNDIYLNIQTPVYYSKTSETQFTVESETTFSMYATVYQGVNATGKVLKPMIRLSTVSDSTFAPYSNICPIIGWDEVNVGVSGVNYLDNSLFTNNKWLENNGTISDYNNRKSTLGYIPIGKIKTFWCGAFLNGTLDSGDYSIKICTYSEANTNSFIRSVPSGINNHTFTFNNNEKFFRIGVTNNNFNTTINYPSTDTSYHAYNGSTITLDLDGTRYGGKVDLVSGVMTVDRAKVALTSNIGITGKTHTANNGFAFSLTNTGINVKNGTSFISSMNVPTFYSQATKTGFCFASSNVPIFFLSDADSGLNSSASDTEVLNAFHSFIANISCEAIYPLATPLTIQLTPTVVKSLRGVNNVFADSGAILDAEYIRDLTAIIDYILEQLNA